MRKNYPAATGAATGILSKTGVFGKQPVESMLRMVADCLCEAVHERNRVTLTDGAGETNLTILTGEVIVSLHITEGRMVI